MVTDTTIIRDTVLFIRDLLAGITDPISSARPTNSKFVMTSYPDRPVAYPLITVNALNFRDVLSGGMRSETKICEIDLEIRIWARNEKEKDQLTDSVYTKLRQSQTDDSTGTIANTLFGFELTSAVNVNEEGKEGIKSKILSVKYITTATS